MNYQPSSPRERTLLRQAKRVADQGRKPAAEKLYKALVEEFPASIDGWLGLARVQRSPVDQVGTLNYILEIDPENEFAKAGLRGESLEKLLNPPEEIEPDPEPVVPVREVVAEPVAQPETAIEPVVVGGETVSADATHTFEPSEDDVVAGLRCNKCGKVLEAHNSVHTPVGYRCKDCVREIEDSYFSATTANYVTALAVALPLAMIASIIVATVIGGVGFFSLLITLFISPTIGAFISSAAFRAAGRNRGRYMPVLMSVSLWLGAFLTVPILIVFGFGFSWLVLAIFAFSSSSAAYFRVR